MIYGRLKITATYGIVGDVVLEPRSFDEEVSIMVKATQALDMGVVDGQVKFVDGGSVGLESLMQTQPEGIQQALGSLTLQLHERS